MHFAGLYFAFVSGILVVFLLQKWDTSNHWSWHVCKIFTEIRKSCTLNSLLLARALLFQNSAHTIQYQLKLLRSGAQISTLCISLCTLQFFVCLFVDIRVQKIMVILHCFLVYIALWCDMSLIYLLVSRSLRDCQSLCTCNSMPVASAVAYDSGTWILVQVIK